jgi:hypothetical protein
MYLTEDMLPLGCVITCLCIIESSRHHRRACRSTAREFKGLEARAPNHGIRPLSIAKLTRLNLALHISAQDAEQHGASIRDRLFAQCDLAKDQR